MINKEKLLEDLDVVDEFSKSEFEKQSHFFIDTLDGQTDKAVKRVDGTWIPKSQMRCDFDGNLYVANWLAVKL